MMRKAGFDSVKSFIWFLFAFLIFRSLHGCGFERRRASLGAAVKGCDSLRRKHVDTR